MYKDVCLQRLIAETTQRKNRLEKHLKLSVEESQRLANEIENITQAFQ